MIRDAADIAPSVHPRLRGELCQRDTAVSGSDGSSPLTRGTLRLCAKSNVSIRFIPAYAGNSSFLKNAMSVSSVHPRLRGELVVLAA